jgi:hypothetical protein
VLTGGPGGVSDRGEGALTGWAQCQGTRALTGGPGVQGARARSDSAIWAVRSRSDGGDHTREDERLRAALLISVAVRSLELRQARARVAPRSSGLGRKGEDATTNSVAGKRP